MPRLRPQRWVVKAAAQGALSLLPGAPRLDRAVRTWSTNDLSVEYFLSKWHHVTAHARAATGDAEGDLTGRRVVELGTGWFPIVPLGLALRGAEVVSVDSTAHLHRRRVALTLQILVDLVASGAISSPEGPRLEVARELAGSAADRPLSETLGRLGVSVELGDASDLRELRHAHGADLLVSNNTLEHIPGPVIAAIFAEFHRVSSPTALMSHYVDLADHYAGVGGSIGEFNFLTLSPARWALVNNRLHFQNRLRIGDYRELHARAGWRITRERCTSRPAAELDGLPFVPPFDTMPPEDLRVVKAHLVSARRAPGADPESG